MFAGNTVNSLKAVDVNVAAETQGNVSGQDQATILPSNMFDSFGPNSPYGGIGGSLAIPNSNIYVPTVTGIPGITTITTTPVPALPGDIVFVHRDDAPVYPEIDERRELYVPEKEPTSELDDLKEQINSSFEEVASLLGGLQDQIADLEGRIARYNGKSSHKI